MRGLIVILAGLFLLPAPAAAEENGVVLDPVIVGARRTPGGAIGAADYPARTTVIDSAAIAASGASSVPELLDRVPGIAAADTTGFGLGADAGVNLRGVANGSRSGVLVLVDGVRQNRVTGDEVHWQSIPLESIDRIEVLRGSGGILYGEGALAGVILITTKKGADKPLRGETGFQWGGFGRRYGYLTARGSAGGWRYGSGVHRRLVRGYRENTASRNTTTAANAGFSGDTFEWNARVLHSQDTSLYSGGITPQQSEARRRQAGSFPGFFDDVTTQVSVDGSAQGPAGLELSATAFARDRSSDSVSSFGRFATLSPSRGLSAVAAHEGALSATLEHTLIAGVDLLDEKAVTGNREGGSLSESNKASYGVFLEETLQWNDRLTWINGARYDRARFAEDLTFPQFNGTLHFEGWTPKTAAHLKLNDALGLYGSIARPYKAPNVDDFSAFVPGGTFFGNLDLVAQQGEEYEIGLRARRERWGEAEATAFHKRVDHEILFNALSFQNENFHTERSGVELSLQPRLPWEQLKPSFAYAFTRAKFRKGTYRGNALPGTPEHAFDALLRFEPRENLAFWCSWRLAHDFFRFNDFANALPADNYGTLDAGARFGWRGAQVFFTVENLTNEEYTSFQSSNGTSAGTGENPSPPRTYLAGAVWRF